MEFRIGQACRRRNQARQRRSEICSQRRRPLTRAALVLGRAVLRIEGCISSIPSASHLHEITIMLLMDVSGLDLAVWRSWERLCRGKPLASPRQTVSGRI
jgi:hypothetical protein